jgi:AcrR family transcriptional regulator
MSTPHTAELLWGDNRRPRRGPKPSLSLERILAEAIALADADGLANLSMQRLAERLGYTKMSLYRYVPGRAELMALMLDFGMGPPVPLPAELAKAGEPPWRTGLTVWTLEIFARYRAHPWSTELTLGARVFGPNEMGWLETALATLAGAALTDAERLDAVALLSGHARNLVQQTAGPPAGTETELVAQLRAVLAEHGARFPHAAVALAGSAAADGRDNALRFGIDRILDGLAALITARSV